MKIIFGFIASLILLGSGYLFLPDDHTARVEVIGDVLFFHGELSEESVNLAIRRSIGHQINTININSGGGEIISAITFAHWIRDNELDVEVTEMCFSSCANYIFLAGMVKYVSEKDLIGWHGGAYQENEEIDDPKMDKLFQAYIKEAQKKETNLYKRLGVNPNITTFGQMEEYYCQHEQQHGWYYSVSDLNKLGVYNIELADGEWNPSLYHSKDICQVNLPNDI